MLIMFALPMMLNFDPEDAVDFGGMDFTHEDARKKFEKLNSENFEDSLKKNPDLKNRVKGVVDDMINAKII